MKKEHRKKVTVIFLIFLLLFCGCGRKQVEYDVNANTDADVISEGISANANGSLAEKLGVEEFWDESVAMDDGRSIRIQAQVMVPDIKNAKILSAEEKYYTGDEIREICETLSDGPVYYDDEAHRTKDEIESQFEDVQAQIDYWSKEGNAESENYFSERLDELHEIYNNAPEERVPVTDFASSGDSEYLISYMGADYSLRVCSGGDSRFGEKMSFLSLTPVDCTQVINSVELEAGRKIEKYYNNDKIDPTQTEYASDNNDCGISIQQADIMVADFLKEIGLEEFRAVEYYKANWTIVSENQEGEGELFTDGMTLILCHDVDGMVIDGNDYVSVSSIHLTLDGDMRGEYDASNYGIERMEVCVTKDGVVGFWYDYPMVIKEVVADDVVLLDYENMLSAMRQCLAEHYGIDGIALYQELELLYFRCKGEVKGEYRIIPVWRLVSRDGETMNHCMMINAIDGSAIDIGGEIYY